MGNFSREKIAELDAENKALVETITAKEDEVVALKAQLAAAESAKAEAEKIASEKDAAAASAAEAVEQLNIRVAEQAADIDDKVKAAVVNALASLGHEPATPKVESPGAPEEKKAPATAFESAYGLVQNIRANFK